MQGGNGLATSGRELSKVCPGAGPWKDKERAPGELSSGAESLGMA